MRHRKLGICLESPGGQGERGDGQKRKIEGKDQAKRDQKQNEVNDQEKRFVNAVFRQTGHRHLLEKRVTSVYEKRGWSMHIGSIAYFL